MEMTMQDLYEPKLTEDQHGKMDHFLDAVFDGVRSGAITKSDFRGKMAHVLAALDRGNTGEAVSWFENVDERFVLGDSPLSGSAKL